MTEQTTRAERMRRPSADEIAAAAAEQHGVCVRPLVMEAGDTKTGELRYVAVPCGSTVESVCAPCAKKARALRIAQCREGWHLDEDPDFTPASPTDEQKALLTVRADLVKAYQEAKAESSAEVDELRDEIRAVDEDLRSTGMRGQLPPVDPPAARKPKKRSTRRRQDAPDLPKRTMRKTTVGPTFAGKYRPSTFVTVTLDSYGAVYPDGTPKVPEAYDYRRAARDAIHFAALLDRLMQNLRRVAGYEVQYFGTVEPQRRYAPHLHAAIRGSVPHKLLRQVVAATYHQVWWPAHDEPVYSDGRMPVWDEQAKAFIDPDSRHPLDDWDTACEELQEPAHVVRFGQQVHSKGILGGTEEAGRHIGYLTKYLVKSVAEVIEPDTVRQQQHADRLHAELAITPCSPRCANWLRYGIQPKGANRKTEPGRCKAKAHRQDTLGLPGRRVLVSRKWSGKSLDDHKADRAAFVREALAAVGIVKPKADPGRIVLRAVRPGDPSVPPRAHLLMREIAERTRWRAEYDRALLAAQGPPGAGDLSATGRRAA